MAFEEGICISGNVSPRKDNREKEMVLCSEWQMFRPGAMLRVSEEIGRRGQFILDCGGLRMWISVYIFGLRESGDKEVF